MWSIEYEYIVDWLDKQDAETVAHVFAALELLERHGPSLGRPLVDTLAGTKIRNLKELRPASSGSSEVRILFAFDPKRKAVMLLAGDKAKGKNARRKWSGWYKQAIPRAEEIYALHVRRLEETDG
ncbi:type II toxin-antitoxin system RelE/ParE family toxin [Eggerthellaceae bacterium zg-893]|nr:type II toxin-antitoxin system RelE/ParE family toxin [Eggerthellaceae bacterium zg-893]